MATNCQDLSDCPEMDLFMNESMCDVVFIIDGQRLPALKTLLSVKSRVFRAMFSENFRESKEKEVVIEDTTFEAFRSLIQFLYCEKLVLKDGNDFQLILDICKLSDRYETPKVFSKITEHLKTMGITFKNLKNVSRIAFDYKIKDLMSYVMAFIDNSFEKFVVKDMKKMIDSNESSQLMEVSKLMAQKYKKLKLRLNEVENKLNDYQRYQCQHCSCTTYVYQPKPDPFRPPGIPFTKHCINCCTPFHPIFTNKYQ